MKGDMVSARYRVHIRWMYSRVLKQQQQQIQAVEK